MSLKAIHLVFISLSVLLAFGFAGWCLHNYTAQSQAGYLATAVIAAIAGVALIVYELRFLRKFKDVGMI